MKRKSRQKGNAVAAENRSDDTGVEPVDPKSRADKSLRSIFVACLRVAVTFVIVQFVFVPWFGRYIDGQFFGLSGDYGTELFRYSQGSLALTEAGIDPYSDSQMFQALEEGQLGTDHPNPYYDQQTSIKAFAETPEPIAKGVVSPPFLLVVLAPLIRLCGYTLALNVWAVASLLGISWLSVLFWQRLIPPAPRWQHRKSWLSQHVLQKTAKSF